MKVQEMVKRAYRSRRHLVEVRRDEFRGERHTEHDHIKIVHVSKGEKWKCYIWPNQPGELKCAIIIGDSGARACTVGQAFRRMGLRRALFTPDPCDDPVAWQAQQEENTYQRFCKAVG